MAVRAFIGIGLPGELKSEISGISSSLSTRTSGVRWVPQENLHITLKFLGDVNETIIPDIQAILDQVARRHMPITCRFGGLGVFPDPGRPKIIWLGVEKGSDRLSELADELNGELARLGFKSELRGYTPHLTLGRVRPGARTTQLKKLLGSEEDKTCRLSNSHGLLNINMLLLQKSILTSKGAIYQILSEHSK